MPSEYVPVTVNCSVVPTEMIGLTGVMARDSSTAGVTVSVAFWPDPPDEMPEDGSIAEIAAVPTAKVEAEPREPTALLIPATEVSDEFQVTVVVRFCVEPSV